MMKLALKILLLLCIIFAGIYAVSPLWLPYILAKQLPPGWQLEVFEAGYPGPSGIFVSSLRVSGQLHVADITLTASDLRFSYQGLKTDIDALSLDINMLSAENRQDDALTLDDLSFPVTNLTGKMPQLAVGELHLVLHHTSDTNNGEMELPPPLVLNFEALKLVPRLDNSFHLATNMRFEEFPEADGRIEIDAGPDLLKAEISFPASVEAQAWLAIAVEQKTQDTQTTTRIDADFDAEQASPVWLDPILMRGSGGWLKHVSGKLRIQADYAGQNLQDIQHLLLSSDNLQLLTQDGLLELKAQLQASREGEEIVLELPVPAEIQYRDETGRIDQLLTSAIPEFQRAPRPDSRLFSKLESGSRFVIKPGASPSVSFDGNIGLDLTSSGEVLKLHADKLQLSMGDFPKPESLTADGLITVEWEENTVIAYTSGDLDLRADKMTVSAELTSHDRSLTSTGVAAFTGGRMNNPATSAERIDMSWQGLDLIGMTGNLGTKTRGFITEVDGETWKGFDFDIQYDLLSDANIRGTGNVNFGNGLQLPIKYSGNSMTDKWDIDLPPATVKLTELPGLLAAGHFKLPESVNLSDGYIDLQGVVKLNQKITAKLIINGHEMDASLHESGASDASFSFDTAYDETLSLSGPVSIETIALAGGIDVTHIKLDLTLENTGTIDLKNLYAEVFEGQVTLGSLRFSNNRMEDTTIVLSHISLARLLAFADIDGLEGTGILDISLPAGSDQTGLFIKDGTFKSNGPGRLAYTNEGVADSNIGLQALKNFHYKDLSGLINYQSDGNYQIRIRLEGKNPDLYDGYPVAFNLNITGSLPALFEALFMTGSFEEAILKEIKKK